MSLQYFHFNPRSPRGERQANKRRSERGAGFQSTLPARGATVVLSDYPLAPVPFQSTLPARGATAAREQLAACHAISIHAPREGSDAGELIRLTTERYFNPRSPRGERHNRAAYCHPRCNFNPRSPRGERPSKQEEIRARRGFQSTLPARGATFCYLKSC